VYFIIDGGRCQVGLESTVLGLTSEIPAILRPGGTSRETIESVIGPVELFSGIKGGVPSGGAPAGDAPLSPGQLKNHYAPRTPLILHTRGEMEAAPLSPGEGRLYFSPPAEGRDISPERVRVLSANSNLTEAAANLFDMLHELDSLGLSLIRAEEVPGSGLGEAINDRLRRAQRAACDCP
jgi:L-threonylcarbamoyladenylate synthase